MKASQSWTPSSHCEPVEVLMLQPQPVVVCMFAPFLSPQPAARVQLSTRRSKGCVVKKGDNKAFQTSPACNWSRASRAFSLAAGQRGQGALQVRLHRALIWISTRERQPPRARAGVSGGDRPGVRRDSSSPSWRLPEPGRLDALNTLYPLCDHRVATPQCYKTDCYKLMKLGTGPPLEGCGASARADAGEAGRDREPPVRLLFPGGVGRVQKSPSAEVLRL
eukprot:scaffold96902_cov60-Phaeocystis_antarctica.AAC.3